jgi:hypothetical protein
MDDPSRRYVDAERTYAALERQRLSGELTEQGYKDALNALRVKDDAGHTWMLQERTGAWYVYRSGAWEQATPPGSTPALTPPSTLPAAAAVAPQTAAPVQGAPTLTPPATPAAAYPATAAPYQGLPPVYQTPPVYQAAPPAYQTPPVYQAVPPVYAAPLQPAAYPPPPPAAAIASPPVAFTPAYAPAPYAGPEQPAYNPPARRSGKSRRYQASGYRPGCLKITLSVIKWEILWTAVGWVVYSAFGRRSPWVLIPVALVAVLLMALYLRRFGRTMSEGARP